MQRLEVITRFILALALSVFLFMSSISLPPIGALLLPFVAQPVLLFGVKYGIGLGLGVVLVALLVVGDLCRHRAEPAVRRIRRPGGNAVGAARAAS